MSTDNFAKLFYAPLMKSLNDLVQLHDLLSEESSKFSNNKAKMPPTGYGTKESPGYIALWLISLGSQKDSIIADTEQIVDPIGEIRQMSDQLISATTAQSDRIHSEVLEIKFIQAHQRDEVSDLKTSFIQLSAASSPDSTPYKPNTTPRKSSFFFGRPDVV